jgi:hypothetical protein
MKKRYVVAVPVVVFFADNGLDAIPRGRNPVPAFLPKEAGT